MKEGRISKGRFRKAGKEERKKGGRKEGTTEKYRKVITRRFPPGNESISPSEKDTVRI